MKSLSVFEKMEKSDYKQRYIFQAVLEKEMDLDTNEGIMPLVKYCLLNLTIDLKMGYGILTS